MNERIKATMRLEKIADPVRADFKRTFRDIPAQGRVYVDITFDGCTLNERIVFSGDLRTAEDLYTGQLTLTADSRLIESDGTERKL